MTFRLEYLDYGESCRATYSVDGEEYEGTVVNKNVGNKSVTVRFHGYNNEEEVSKLSIDLLLVLLHFCLGFPQAL